MLHSSQTCYLHMGCPPPPRFLQNGWYFQDVWRGRQRMHQPARDDQHHIHHGWAGRGGKGEFSYLRIWVTNNLSRWCQRRFQYFGLTHPLVTGWPFIGWITQLTHFLDQIIAALNNFEFQSTLANLDWRSYITQLEHSQKSFYYCYRIVDLDPAPGKSLHCHDCNRALPFEWWKMH